MFTGIIEEVGRIISIRKKGGGIRFTVSAKTSSKELKISDSVSINGVCQTVITKTRTSFEVEAVEETLLKTTLGSLKTADEVNLELPMRLNERLGGHLVLGHVDSIGQITKIDKRESSWMFTIKIPKQFLHYTVPVGSIAVDGVSLTIAELKKNTIRVSIIPHTLSNTIFRNYQLDNHVNLEFDIIGKYIERLITNPELQSKSNTKLTENVLRKFGY